LRHDETASVERREAASRFGRIEVYEDPADAAAVWTELEASPQPRLSDASMALALARHHWAINCVCPMIVVAYGTNHSPVALFSFGLFARRVRLVNFLGGCDSNSNLGLPAGTQLDKSDIGCAAASPPLTRRG